MGHRQSVEAEFAESACKLFDKMFERDVCNMFVEITVVKLGKFHE
jgi:hypothetical protein